MQLQQRLVANVIIDKCGANQRVIFRDSWCTQDRIIRFTTPFFRKLFQTTESMNGYWKTGDMAMYEVYLSPDSFSIECIVCQKNATVQNKEIVNVLSQFPTYGRADVNMFSLKKWIFGQGSSIEQMFADFDLFMEKELDAFEKSVVEFMDRAKQEPYLEGAQETYIGSKYERNAKARAACLAHHGTACAICGIDFGKTYGPEFTGQIEVHHIVPLSQIGEEYIVDPIRDLVPLCPNCHTAIHSKKDGVYTIEEMKRRRNS